MNAQRVHLHRRWFENPACGSHIVDPLLTENPVEVTCQSCWRTSAFKRMSMCWLPREHPVRSPK